MKKIKTNFEESYAETFDEEVKKCLENVIEIETNYINECQKKALRYETYCDNCSPYCLKKTYK